MRHLFVAVSFILAAAALATDAPSQTVVGKDRPGMAGGRAFAFRSAGVPPALLTFRIPGAHSWLPRRHAGSTFGSLVGRGFSRNIKDASVKLSFRRIFRRAFVVPPLLNSDQRATIRPAVISVGKSSPTKASTTRGVVLKKNLYLKTLASVVIIGIPTLLFLGAIYSFLSAREWAIGMIAWVATLLFWAGARKRAVKQHLVSRAEPGPVVDDDARDRILRDIRKRKVWIGVLVVLLPIGIANGAAHRAWLPTLAGMGISLSIVYVALREIKHLREQLNLIRADGQPFHTD